MSKKNADRSPSRITYKELEALPISGGTEIVTDPATGHSEQVSRPMYFLVDNSDVLFYRMADGSYWKVGFAPDGKRYKQRFPI